MHPKNFNLLRLCFIFLITLKFNFAIGQDRSRYMQPCLSVIPSKTVTLSVKPVSPEFILDLSIKEITSISEKWGNDLNKIGYSNKFHSYGYTATEILVGVESDAQGLYLDPNRKPLNDSEQPKLMCFKAGVNIRLSFETFRIYIAKDFKHNKCMHDGIRRHEIMHAQLYEENIKKLGEEIKSYAISKTQGKIFFVENSQLFDGKSLAADITSFGTRRWAEMKDTHKAIDDIYGFDALEKECRAEMRLPSELNININPDYMKRLEPIEISAAKALPVNLEMGISHIQGIVEKASLDRFLKRNRTPSTAVDKDDFRAMIKSQRSRHEKYPAGVYKGIARVLSTGVMFAPCRKDGTINLECIDFDRLAIIEANASLAFLVAKEASQLNITHLPLAEHFRVGSEVQKSLLETRKLFEKEAALDRGFNLQDESIKLIKSELKNYNPSVKIDADLDLGVCNLLLQIASIVKCPKEFASEDFQALEPYSILRKSPAPSIVDIQNRNWISENPLIINGVVIKGLDFGREGITYAQVSSDGVRQQPSSFDYSIENSAIKIRIKFSASKLKEGSEYFFEAGLLNRSILILKHGESMAIYRIIS